MKRWDNRTGVEINHTNLTHHTHILRGSESDPCHVTPRQTRPSVAIQTCEASFPLTLLLIRPDRVIAWSSFLILLFFSLHSIPPSVHGILPLSPFLFPFPSPPLSSLPSCTPLPPLLFLSLCLPTVHGHRASSSFPSSHCSTQFMHGSVNPPSPLPANPHPASMDSANTSQNHGRGPQHSYGATSSIVPSAGVPPLSPQQLSLQQQQKLHAKTKLPRPIRYGLRHSASNGSLSSTSISSSASSVYGSAGSYSPDQQDQLSTQGTKWQTKVREGQGVVVRFLRRRFPILGWLILDPGYNWRANAAEDVFAGISKYQGGKEIDRGESEDPHLSWTLPATGTGTETVTIRWPSKTTSDSRGNPVCLWHSFPLLFFFVYKGTDERDVDDVSHLTFFRFCASLVRLVPGCILSLGMHEQVPVLSPPPYPRGSHFNFNVATKKRIEALWAFISAPSILLQDLFLAISFVPTHCLSLAPAFVQ